jgi:hypothetical protein
MDVSAVGSLGGLAAAEMMFAVTAQAAAAVGSQGDSSSDAATAGTSSRPTGVGVAVLRMALDSERSLVNILA